MLRPIVNAVAKRLPSHVKDRAEEILLGLRDFERLKVPRESAMTIVCDDGEAKDLNVVKVLDRQGVRGVFAVSPDLIGRPGFLTYAQLRSIRAAGHEIAFHGATHDPFTGFADMGKLLDAVGHGLRQFEDEGLGTPRTLIYPFGRHDRKVRGAMAPLFESAFTTWFGINRDSTNRYAIRRIPFGAYIGKLPANESWYRDLLDRCAGGHCWPTLMLHPSASDHTEAHNALLSRLIDHARDRGMPVRTAVAYIGACGGAPNAVATDTAHDGRGPT